MKRSTKTGVATKIDEYVPTIIPTRRAKEKPLKDGPPNKNNTCLLYTSDAADD